MVDETQEAKRNWYVVHAHSGYENKVVEYLKERIKLDGLEAYFGDIFVPTETVVEMRGGQKRKVTRKFFPGYVLVHMEMTDETMYAVRKTSKVLGFIGGKKEEPAPLPEVEVKRIFSRLQSADERVVSSQVFEPGEVVKVVDGPFNGFEGARSRGECGKESIEGCSQHFWTINTR